MTTKLAWISLAAVLLAGCGGNQPITGSFTLTDPDVTYSAASCSGTGGYSDVKVGVPVVVRDEAGKTIGTSDLAYDAAGSGTGRCRFTFTVAVTDIAKFYEVEVGHRGKLTYSLAEMEAMGWKVSLTLGG